MRHRAGWYPGDFGHRLCRYYRYGRGHHIAMQIEVDDKKEVAVRGDVQGARKVTQRGFLNKRVVFRRILPDGSKRPAVCDRDVVKLPIGRDDDAVWSINVHRHVS